MLQDGDRDGFVDRFREVKDWFGDLGQRFLQESSFMLERAAERYSERRQRSERRPVTSGSVTE